MRRSHHVVSAALLLVLAVTVSVRAEQPRFKIWAGGPVFAVALTPDGKFLASGDEDGGIRITDVATGKEVHRIATKSPIRALAFTADGKTLAAKNQMGPFTLYETTKWAVTKTSPSHNSNSSTIAFSKNGDTVLGAAPWEYEFWEPTRGSMSSSRGGGQPVGSFAAVSPDAQTVLWGQPNGYLQFMQPRGGMWRQIRAPKANHAAFGPDGKTLAIIYSDKSIRLWDWTVGNTGKELKKLADLTEEPGHVVFSADGKTLLTVGKYETVLTLLDVATGKELRRVVGSRGSVECVALSADGKLAATGSLDGRSRIWDLTGEAEKLPEASNPSEKELQALYADLSSTDPVVSRKAFATLLVNDKQSVPFLTERVRTTALLKVDPRVTKLIADLDSDEFEVRESASDELARLGESIAPALRQALTTDVSYEVRSRITRLLKSLKEQTALSPDFVRVFEALELLEQLATPEARTALAMLSKESLESRVLREVRGAVERLPKP